MSTHFKEVISGDFAFVLLSACCGVCRKLAVVSAESYRVLYLHLLLKWIGNTPSWVVVRIRVDKPGLERWLYKNEVFSLNLYRL